MLKEIINYIYKPKPCDYCGEKLLGYGNLSMDSKSWICPKCALIEVLSNEKKLDHSNKLKKISK